MDIKDVRLTTAESKTILAWVVEQLEDMSRNAADSGYEDLQLVIDTLQARITASSIEPWPQEPAA